MASQTSDPFEHTRMTLGEHLEELRKRLFRSVLVLGIAFGAAWWFKDEVALQVMGPWRDAVVRINAELALKAEADLAAHPEKPRTEYYLSADPADTRLRDALDPRLTSMGVGESFYFALYNSLYFAAFLGGPFVLWQMWQFIAAGLYLHEKRLIGLYFPASVLLFLGGVVFAYLAILPTGLYYLTTTFGTDLVRSQLTLEKYFDFLSTMCLAMGAVFQLPIVMIFLARIGLVEPKTYGKYRGHFVVVALLVAAVLTPGPDWISQVLMAGPMLVLYEVGILVARMSAKPRQIPGAG